MKPNIVPVVDNPAYDRGNNEPIFPSDEEVVYEYIENEKAADKDKEYAEIASSQEKDLEVLYEAADW